jgi:hypothetical protein
MSPNVYFNRNPQLLNITKNYHNILARGLVTIIFCEKDQAVYNNSTLLYLVYKLVPTDTIVKGVEYDIVLLNIHTH